MNSEHPTVSVSKPSVRAMSAREVIRTGRTDDVQICFKALGAGDECSRAANPRITKPMESACFKALGAGDECSRAVERPALVVREPVRFKALGAGDECSRGRGRCGG